MGDSTVWNSAYTLTYTPLRQLVRVGHTPVAEVTATHPVLSLVDTEGEDDAFSAAVRRFNEAYRSMAEAFLQWGLSAPAEAAAAAFVFAGAGAAYTFDRRLLTCTMEAEWTENGILLVCRRVLRGSRRGLVPTERREGLDRWRAEDLTLVRDDGKAAKKFAHS